MIAGKHLRKDRQLYAAFIDLEKEYERVNGKGLWDIPGIIYGVCGKLLQDSRPFYRDVRASVFVNRELSESSGVGVGASVKT